jgi:cytochrome P450 family 135
VISARARPARDLAPGPAAPAVVQTWWWLRRSPLELLEAHQRRYGETFRLEILGPRYRRDRTRWPLARRTVVVYAAPRDVHEVFQRTGGALRAGEAQEFLEWFLGPRSLMVLDDAEHRDERRDMLALFGPDQLAGFERSMQRSAAAAVGGWAAGRGIDLRGLIDHAFEAVNFAIALGVRPDDIMPLIRLTRRARTVFAAPLLFLPVLRVDLGARSPGGCVTALRAALRDVIQRRARDFAAGAGAAEPCLLDTLLARAGGGLDADLEAVLDRVITILGGMDNASAATAWACTHLLRHPAALERVGREVRECPDDAVPGPDSFLEAVCKESLRLHPPFPAIVRRVTQPVSIGGVDLVPGMFVLASMYLLHRRADLFPEPEAFRPERFTDVCHGFADYVPFGAGLRHCVGHAFAARQMRVVLAEILRRFEVEPDVMPALAATRRNVTVFPASPARATLRLRAAAAPDRPDADTAPAPRPREGLRAPGSARTDSGG